MKIKLRGVPPEFVIDRDNNRCIRCRVCENQCSFKVHKYNNEEDSMNEESYDCVGCHRCEALCPINAIKIMSHL